MNLLRKSFYTSITHSNKSSSIAPYLFSLTHNHKPTPYSTLTTAEHDRRIHTENVSEYNTAIGLLTAPRRFMSTSKGRSTRSKVEKRMQRETGKTLREMRRAKKLRKKLMTDDERLIYNLRRAKKKASLLLQKLKKYELPDFPPPRHDPELLTPEQLQAYKKIGFRNRNYVPVGVRGVFGGVVQNMHLHWKFHETVQVCCDNFPKEKIKEMATMLARLSGGIVVNIHDVTTVIMFRGRNYRQPKNLIPLNTLTKRKALFKARFEQALESQKLNIKKIEQQLRRKGVNPEDPVHMASIQRVASTFFRAIDEQQGTPYVFKQMGQTGPSETLEFDPKQDGLEEEDSDQEELDRFIKEIEDSADQEWEEEEEREKEEENKVRYWNREDFEYSQRRLDVRRDADRNNEDYDDEDGSEDDRDRDRGNKNKPRGNFNKLRDRNERIEFDSGSDSDEDCAKKRGFGRGGLRGSGKRVESDEEVWGIEEDSRDYVRDSRHSGDEDENEESNRGSFGVVSERNSDENWDSD